MTSYYGWKFNIIDEQEAAACVNNLPTTNLTRSNGDNAAEDDDGIITRVDERVAGVADTTERPAGCEGTNTDDLRRPSERCFSSFINAPMADEDIYTSDQQQHTYADAPDQTVVRPCLTKLNNAPQDTMQQNTYVTYMVAGSDSSDGWSSDGSQLSETRSESSSPLNIKLMHAFSKRAAGLKRVRRARRQLANSARRQRPDSNALASVTWCPVLWGPVCW